MISEQSDCLLIRSSLQNILSFDLGDLKSSNADSLLKLLSICGVPTVKTSADSSSVVGF